MPSNKNAVIRYKILDELLSDSSRQYTREMLVQRVNEALDYDSHGYSFDLDANYKPTVTKRTVEKDLRAMEEIFEVELVESSCEFEYLGRKKTVRYADQTRSIFSKPLSSDEKKLLLEVFNTLGQFSGLDNFEWINELKTKLSEHDSFGISAVDGVDTEQRKVIDFSSNEYLKNKEYLAWFFTAISNKRVVRIKYRKFDSAEAKDIILYPYMLKQFNGRWYLLGTPDLDPDLAYNPNFIANFPLDRIEEKAYYDGIPYIDCPVNLEDIYDEIYGMTYYWDKPVEHIILACKNSTYNYIKTKPIHPYQTPLDTSGQDEYHRRYPELTDYFFLRFDLKLNRELESLIRSYGDDLIVIEPKELRDRICEKSESTLKIYKMLSNLEREAIKKVDKRGEVQ